MRIAVCDDNESDREILKKYIEAYSNSRCLYFNISVFQCGEDLLESALDIAYDVVFLDVYMDGINGIETAKALKERMSSCRVIITTSSQNHAIESFEVDAAHYLLKPLSYEKVVSALDRCKQIFCLSDRYIEVISDRVPVHILLKEIIFIEVFGNMTVFHTITGKVRTYMPLDDIILFLPKEEFIHCHRSYIVNLNFITEVRQSDFIMTNEEKIPIRRGDRQQMKQLYANNLFRLARSGHVLD